MKPIRHWIAGSFILSAIATQGLAHHSMTAEYDSRKPVSVKGTVTKFDWTNPHVAALVDATGSDGAVTTWSVEFPSRVQLKAAGWTGESLKVGDVILVEGDQARDGSREMGARSATLGSGKKLAMNAPAPSHSSEHSKPTPRGTDGHPLLGFVPGEVGYWGVPASPNLYENSASSTIRMNADGLLANVADAGKVAPFLPWAKGLYEYRQRNFLKDDPMASCLPPGGPRQFQTPNGIQIVEQPERKRIFIMSGGGDRNWRLINLDGRAHQPDDVTPTYYGDSVGHWDGDTLVVDAIGFNERFWFMNGGLPHTEQLHLTERLSRPDFDTLKYEVTVDDPGAYARPWKAGMTLKWVPNQEIEEYFCDEYNRDSERSGSK